MGTNNELMKTLTFGVEIEMTGITRSRAAKVIAKYFGGDSFDSHSIYGYNSFTATDRDGRDWKCMNDASIIPVIVRDGEKRLCSSDYKTEVVTPILNYKDIEDLQEIIRLLRKEGAFVNKTCGIHIHIGARKFTPAKLRNLANIFTAHEDLLYKALEVDSSHRNTCYCEKTSINFIDKINKSSSLTDDDLAEAWYGANRAIVEVRKKKHYDDSRYHGLNLHAFWQKRTVEFRLFNSTLHAGKIKAYIQFCLALAQQALVQKRANYKKKEITNEKYAFRCWMLRLGLIGEEFKTCRLHFLAKLDGNSAWRYGSRQVT